MKNYKQLQKEFDKKVKELQKNCKHKKTEWTEDWWAPGHTTGYDVKICKFCDKIIEKKKREEIK